MHQKKVKVIFGSYTPGVHLIRRQLYLCMVTPSQYTHSFIGRYLCTITTFQYNTHLVSTITPFLYSTSFYQRYGVCYTYVHLQHLNVLIVLDVCMFDYTVLVQSRHLQSFLDVCYMYDYNCPFYYTLVILSSTTHLIRRLSFVSTILYSQCKHAS